MDYKFWGSSNSLLLITQIACPMPTGIDFFLNQHFNYITNMTKLENVAQQTLPCMEIIKFTISIYPSLVIVTITVFGLISAQIKQQGREFLKQIKYFHLMTNMVISYCYQLAQEPLPRGSCKIYNIGRPSLAHHYMHYK